MVIVLIGPMGSGKTTIGKMLAQTNGWQFADGDDYHSPENIAKMGAGIPLTDADRKPWLLCLAKLIQDSLATDASLVLACSALKKQYRELLGIDQRRVISVYLKGSQELLAQRITTRQHQYMDKNLLTSQISAMEEPTDGLIVEVSSSPQTIVQKINLNLKTRFNHNQEKTMKHIIGIAGLAVMGENLVLNMASKGFSVAVYNRTQSKTEKFVTGRGKSDKIEGFTEIKDFVDSLARPRRIMMMLKAGAPVDEFIEQLLPHLEKGDIIIDGGNSNYHDTNRRHAMLVERGLLYIGTGVSGGEEGALKGPSIMPGGSKEAWPHVKDIFTATSALLKDGSACCEWMGPEGAGHFVKMVHNGIEYGDMQLICETYQFMQAVLGMDHTAISQAFATWQQGDLDSYLIEITAEITAYLDEDGQPLVEKILDAAGQKGTGKWTVNAALDCGVPLSLISESVFARCLSSQKELRLEAAKNFSGPPPSEYKGDRVVMVEKLGKALYCAKIISYAQGFGLLQQASQAFNWDLDFAAIARIWRGGCIIRSKFLDRISEAYQVAEQPANMLLAPYFTKTLQESQASLREILAAGILAGIPLPCHSAANAYYDGLRTANLPANLLQAQRDYFGAHMYERKDNPRGEWFHTNWTGTGGDTTSTAYTK